MGEPGWENSLLLKESVGRNSAFNSVEASIKFVDVYPPPPGSAAHWYLDYRGIPYHKSSIKLQCRSNVLKGHLALDNIIIVLIIAQSTVRDMKTGALSNF